MGDRLSGRQVKHVYFVAETKGSMLSLDLRKIEEAKISCARKFFGLKPSREGFCTKLVPRRFGGSIQIATA